MLDVVERVNRMRRIRGIDFAEDYSGWHARIAGTGLEVREAMKIFDELGRDSHRLRVALEWLSEAQINAALTYYELYPEEIDEYIAAEYAFEEEARQQGYPTIALQPMKH